MALQTSGAISLNDIHVEVGGTSGTLVSANDADVRGLTGIASGVSSSFNSFYGTSAINSAGPTTISYSYWGYPSLGGIIWGGYYNDLFDNFKTSDINNSGMSVANAQTYHPYGKLGSASTNPLSTPSGYLVREIGKAQGLADKGTASVEFYFSVSGHVSNANSVFTSVRVNKGQGSDTTFTRASAYSYYQTHAFTKNASYSYFGSIETQNRNTSDPITVWSWRIGQPSAGASATAAWKAIVGWGDGSNGYVSNMEIL